MSKSLRKWVKASFALTVGLSAVLPGGQVFANKAEESTGEKGLHLEADVLSNELVSVIVELNTMFLVVIISSYGI